MAASPPPIPTNPLNALRADRALQLAYASAAHAAALLRDDEVLDVDLAWPSLGRDPAPAANVEIGRDLLAPFVRANREAPPEALYIHARHAAHRSRLPWATLPLPDIFAYALFVLVLIQADAAIATAKAEREAAERDAQPRVQKRPGRDDHTMEQLDGAFDRDVFVDPRMRGKRSKLTLPKKEK